MEGNSLEKFFTSPVANNLVELLMANDAMSDISWVTV
jgi:hypothetical protein